MWTIYPSVSLVSLGGLVNNHCMSMPLILFTLQKWLGTPSPIRVSVPR